MHDGDQPDQLHGRALARRPLVVTAAGVVCLIAGALLAGFEGGVLLYMARLILRILGLGLIGLAAWSAGRRWREARLRK